MATSRAECDKNPTQESEPGKKGGGSQSEMVIHEESA